MSIALERPEPLRRSRGSLLAWNRFDYVMVLGTLGLVAFGLLLIYSGSRNVYDGPQFSLGNPVVQQGMFAVIGLVMMVIISRFDYHYLTHYWWVLYGASIVSLVGVYLFGQTEFGATRWFNVGPLQLQPSEFAKVAVIVTLAHFFHRWGGDARDIRAFLMSLLIVAPILGLVLIQPDLGTALIFAAIWLGVVVIAGVNQGHLMVLGALFIAILPFAWTFVVADYQVERVSILINPYADQEGLGAGYNPIQAEIAVGSGQLLGKGPGQGEQTQLDYLKVPTRDFIFSVLGEELGFVGAVTLLGLYLLVLMRGIRVAEVAGDAPGQLIAVGIVVMIAMQAFINIAVNLGIFPVTGLPLPFVSQGGSSLVSLFVSLGILQSVRMRNRAYRQY